MNLWKALWADENGFVVTAEAALLATVGVVGATVGVKAAAQSVNDELTEVASAFRTLDQSYSYNGFCSSRAYTAGSRYVQPPVEDSVRELDELDDDDKKPNRRKFRGKKRRMPRERRDRKSGPSERRKTGQSDNLKV